MSILYLSFCLYLSINIPVMVSGLGIRPGSHLQIGYPLSIYQCTCDGIRFRYQTRFTSADRISTIYLSINLSIIYMYTCVGVRFRYKTRFTSADRISIEVYCTDSPRTTGWRVARIYIYGNHLVIFSIMEKNDLVICSWKLIATSN